MKFIFGVITGIIFVVVSYFLWNFYGPATSMPQEAQVFTDTVKTMLTPKVDTTSTSANTATTLPLSGSEPVKADWLTPGQRAALAAFGISESSLPKELTPELEACFVGAIGADRVAAVKAGVTPSLFEMGKAAKCL